ncbi:DUF535 family protein [Escherichia coli]|nr:DUF535 domain-containing protein [Escherichia coli]EIK7911772.1 DUF535 family protein [Escherichia coli]EJK7323855.1 DUF535 family protein [Escherichia coli]ELI5581209.1 DUF535 family protein [Escherichia coli]EMB3556331.1 DUF535 family protein [Escherichia coli]
MNKPSVIYLFINLMISKKYHRGKWKNKTFRYKFFFRCCIKPISIFIYLRDLYELDYIEQLLEANPTLPGKPQRPYLYKGGDFIFRVHSILDHYHFVQSLPYSYRKKLLVYQDTILAEFNGSGGEQADIICTPCCFDREGELMLILRFKNIVISRLSFSFIVWKGEISIFIGGLQGPPKHTNSEVLKIATKSFYGLFPHRLLCEIIIILANICGIKRIMAVYEHNHVLTNSRYFYRKKGRFVAKYSEYWESIGSIKDGGFYRLPNNIHRKEISEIPARKRAKYRRRYIMLDNISQNIIYNFNE